MYRGCGICWGSKDGLSRSSNGYRGCYYSFSSYSWMYSMSRSGYNSVESIVIISGIMNSTDGTVGFVKRIRTFYNITITNFLLGFLISSVCVSYSIVECVFGVSLKRNFNCVIINLNRVLWVKLEKK